MGYVVPNSKIQLFKGISLDNRYLHTIYFPSEASQNNWFSGKVFKTYNEMMYRRQGSEAVKIEADATELLGVTYMRFQNTRSASKWFYCFVNYIDYVNENTAVVYYEIDVMQTWFIQNGVIKPCMVKREHVRDDTFGLNLEAEPIGSDCYDSDEIMDNGQHIFEDDFSEYYVVAQTTGTDDSTSPSGDTTHFVQGLFTGCRFYKHVCDDESEADNIHDDIGTMLGSWSQQLREEDVIDIYTVPSICLGQQGSSDQIGYDSSGSLIRIPSRFDNYTPKNKKLFMYPFSYLMLTTHSGDSAIYRWEYFEGTTGSPCEFDLEGTFIGGGEVRCFPKSYNGQSDNVDSGVIINNFPKNAASYDSYQAWIAAGGTNRLDNDRLVTSFKGVGAIMGSVESVANLLGAGMPNPTTTTTTRTNASGSTSSSSRVTNSVTDRNPVSTFGSASGVVGGVMSSIGGLIEAKNNMDYKFLDAQYHPNIVVGKPTACLPVAARDLGTYFFHTHVRDDEAKRIDDFFTCYGYAINRVKIPTITGRRYWNFIQTENAVIGGNMPSSSKEAIGRIFDSGITFWHNGDEIGNYQQSVSDGSINNPIT